MLKVFNSRCSTLGVSMEVNLKNRRCLSFEGLLKSFKKVKNYDALVTYFFKKLHDDFNVKKTYCFGVNLAECLDKAHQSLEYLALTPVNEHSNRSTIETIAQALTKKIKESPLPTTPHIIKIEDASYHWVSIHATKDESYAYLWEHRNEFDETYYPSIVHLFLNEASWFQKLHRTKALLYIDDLTNLYNYRYLDIALESEIRRASRYENSFCLLFLDLDDFKKVNDLHGHLVGSKILQEFAIILKEELREVDTIIRYGGDEYVVLLIGSDTKVGLGVAERLRERVSRHWFTRPEFEIRLTCSIGVSCFPKHGSNKEQLLKMADETMYHSKKQGKNQVHVVSNMCDNRYSECSI